MPAAAVPTAQAVLAERFGTPLTEVGGVREGQGLTAEWEDGTRTDLEPDGWDHFGP